MKPSIAILGAGISGLTLGWAIKQKYGDTVTLSILEKENRPGGWIQTNKQQGFLFEQGPHSCRAASLDTLELLEKLNLQEETLVGDPSAQKRYLWLDQKLQALPNSFLGLLSSPLTRGTIGPFLREVWRKKSTLEDETIYDFFSRRLNSKIADCFIDPFVSGIYAGDIRQLSLQACFPLLHEWEQQKGSLIKGFFSHERQAASTPFQDRVLKSGLFSFKNGMETLPKALATYLTNEIQLNAPVKSLQFHPASITINSNINANLVISTLPAPAIAPIIKSSYPEVSSLLANIPHASLAIVHLGWNQPVLNKKGFGYLVPSMENESILGVIWNSSVFPAHQASAECVNLSVMIGGARFSRFSTYSPETFVQIALDAVKKHLLINQMPDLIAHKIISQAIPQYNLGHLKKVAAIQNFHPCLKLLGSSYFGISINDCIYQALRIAEKNIFNKT